MNHQDVAHVGGDAVEHKQDVSGLMQHVRTRTMMSGPDDVWAKARTLSGPDDVAVKMIVLSRTSNVEHDNNTMA